MHLIIQKCVLLSNQKCIIPPTLIKPTLINLHSTDYSQKFRYDPFAVKLGKCVWSCNTLNDLSNKYVFQIKQYLNLSVFNMVAGINESKTLTKHTSCKCKCRFDGKKFNSDQL